MSKNNLRGITLDIGPILGIHSLTLIVSCYRSISLLSCFNRIFEKLVYKRMKFLIEEKTSNVRHNMALGKGIQRNTRYLKLSVEFNQIHAGAFSCGVFIDLKKAFDTVNHIILIHDLDFNGFLGIILSITKILSPTHRKCGSKPNIWWILPPLLWKDKYGRSELYRDRIFSPTIYFYNKKFDLLFMVDPIWLVWDTYISHSLTHWLTHPLTHL